MSICREHADLMRELARGCLDDDRSIRAETVREECADCARWWEETFSGEAYGAVEDAVADVISAFAPPARRRYRWLAAVAALVLAVGVATTSMLWRDAQSLPAQLSDVVSTWDFEPGTLNESVAAVGEATVENEDPNDRPAVFLGDFESGDLSGWATGS